MELILNFPSGWYLISAIAILIWVFLLSRVNKKERKDSAGFGIVALIFGILVEIMGVSFGAWTYTGGNWPVILWLNYFLYGAASYLVFIIAKKRRF